MLKNTKYYQKQNRIIMKSFMFCICVLLIGGISVSPISWEENPIEMTLQVIVIASMLIVLFIYIFTKSVLYKRIFISLITIYIYNKFWVFPETAIMLSLFALAPIIPIFLLDRFFFYLVSTLNFILGPLFIIIICNTSLKDVYQYISFDGFGNVINFLAIQVLLVFVFIGTNNRMKASKALYKEVQEATKLNSIGQLAATVAHEIRNPITVVKGFAQILEEDKSRDEKETYFIQTMLSELEYTQVIINDFLSLAKPQTDQLQLIELNKEIKKVCDLLTSFANQNNVGIQFLQEQVFTIKMNPIELKQVLVNIIKNGIEAMKNPGFITIELVQMGDMAKIIITDSGEGMTKQQLKNLGTPFYSLKHAGTGIGLTVSYNIIQKYKGKIIVESEINKGTTFSIYIPLQEPYSKSS